MSWTRGYIPQKIFLLFFISSCVIIDKNFEYFLLLRLIFLIASFYTKLNHFLNMLILIEFVFALSVVVFSSKILFLRIYIAFLILIGFSVIDAIIGISILSNTVRKSGNEIYK